LQQGEQQKAIRNFEKAVEVNPDFYHRASQNLKRAKAGNVFDIFSIKSDN
jgi:hypothetical protein